MLAPVTHILPLTTIRRERTLPAPGKVLVRKGQKVSATDTIAEANLAPEHLLLDISRGLGVRVEAADELLQVQAGQAVEQRDVLAGPVGLTRRVVRAPSNGRVVVAGNGQVLLEVESARFELKAGLPGTVIELLSNRGVVIETTGALLQGVWGNGGVDFGLMHVLAKSPDGILAAASLDVSLRGSVVLGGHCSDVEALRAASELPLRGLILASLATGLAPVAARVRYPVLVLDGLGRQPMNQAAFKLLATSDQREVAVNAQPWDHFRGARPEVVIPLPATGELPLPPDAVQFKPGQTVLVQRAPYQGRIGTLASLRPGQTALPNGVRAPAGDVRLENGETAVLPLANLVVLV